MYKIQDDNGTIFSSSSIEEAQFEFDRMSGVEMLVCEKCGWVGYYEGASQFCPECGEDSLMDYISTDEWSGDLELVEVLAATR